MARMYSRKKGKSGSKKPLEDKKLTWMRYKKKEVELLVAKLARESKTSSQIGLFLRDTYGIPDVKKLTGLSITQIMAERKLAPKMPEDLLSLMRKNVLVQKHAESNKKDMTAKRGMQLTDAKIRRLVKYYKRTNKLPEDFKYDPSNIRMYVE